MKALIASVHERSKPFKCELFKTGFTQTASLKVHIATVHQQNKPFKCELCDTCFIQKASLKVHTTTIYEGSYHSNVNYVMLDLNKKVTSKYTPQQFMKEKKPFKCEM